MIAAKQAVAVSWKHHIKERKGLSVDWLLTIVPRELVQQFLMQLSSCFRLLISVLLFAWPLERKRHYGIRLVLSLLLCMLALTGTSLLRVWIDTLATRAFMRFVQFCMPLLIIMCVYGGSVLTRLKVLCASIGATEIGLSVFSLLLALAGQDERNTISFLHLSGTYNTSILDWLIFFGVNTLVYFALFRLFRYERRDELDEKSRPATILLTVFCFLVLTVPDCLRSEFSPDSAAYLALYRFCLTSISMFILLFCSDISFRSQYRMEKTVFDQVLAEERKQYQQLKENIDLINMRCHDLRHQLDDFSGRLTEREIAELGEAMDIYDSNIRTGNEVIDVVLRLAQLTCRKENIELSCMVDGSALSFMKTRHLYSLFNNAVSNAIEAVRKLDEMGKRVIDVTVSRHNGLAEVEVMNYYDGAEINVTSKADSHRHGFGTMSMRYITEEYGGRFQVQTKDDTYTLLITLPVPSSAL